MPLSFQGYAFCVNVWSEARTPEDMFEISRCVRRAAGRIEAASHSSPDGWKRDMQFRCRRGESAKNLLDRILRTCPTVKAEIITNKEKP